MSTQQILSTIVRKKTLIIKCFLLSFLGLTLLLIISYFFPNVLWDWKELGRKTGDLSVIFLSLSLLPGIIKRLGLKHPISKFTQPIQIILMTFRRQIGQAMFVFAFAHYAWAKILPALEYQANPLAINTFELLGSLALFLTIPLFLTSNDISMKLLKKRWNTLHKFSYVVTLFVLLHLSLLGRLEGVTVIAGLTLILEIISWTKALAQKK